MIPKQLRCSFCEKSKEEVQRLISGPSVYICNECITLSNEILEEEGVQLVLNRPQIRISDITLIDKMGLTNITQVTKALASGESKLLADIVARLEATVRELLPAAKAKRIEQIADEEKTAQAKIDGVKFAEEQLANLRAERARLLKSLDTSATGASK